MSNIVLPLRGLLVHGVVATIAEIREYVGGASSESPLPVRLDSLRPILFHEILYSKISNSVLFYSKEDGTYGLRIEREEIECIFPKFVPEDGGFGWLYFHPLVDVDEDTYELIDRVDIYILSDEEFRLGRTPTLKHLSSYNSVAEAYKHIHLSIIQCLETLT